MITYDDWKTTPPDTDSAPTCEACGCELIEARTDVYAHGCPMARRAAAVATTLPAPEDEGIGF